MENYASSSIAVVQNGSAVAILAAGSSSTPTTAVVTVLQNTSILIQVDGGSWNTICTVEASKVVAGATFKNNVAWGQPCNCN